MNITDAGWFPNVTNQCPPPSGTVASRLRRMSDSGAVAPPSPMPLPDIVPIGRDRSLSAPDARAMARQRARRTGREVGRELRRLSDEFNMSFRRNLVSIIEGLFVQFPFLEYTVKPLYSEPLYSIQR